MCKNHFGLKGTALFFQTFSVRFCCRNGECLGHQVDFRSGKMGQRMIPMLVCPSLLVTQMASIYNSIILNTLNTHIWFILIYMIYISGPCVSITHELLHGSGPWLVNLWHRCLSLQPVGHDRGPHRDQVSPFLAEFSEKGWNLISVRATIMPNVQRERVKPDLCEGHDHAQRAGGSSNDATG